MSDPAHRPESVYAAAVVPPTPGRPASAAPARSPLLRMLSPESVKAGACGVALTLILAALIAIGSRNLAHFDAALVGYTFATLFAVFGLTYRYSMWLQRPPTTVY